MTSNAGAVDDTALKNGAADAQTGGQQSHLVEAHQGNYTGCSEEGEHVMAQAPDTPSTGDCVASGGTKVDAKSPAPETQ